ncbi:DUF1573 domain-containing protein [Halosquirtibacter laminarini]|uniref:DUF1573 domain-containing protein n=1 Tax=Halosquirtibacter laminarini TaxID=3374600 RepID=A0AC61NDR6_9BACT|nr:DUF1573 domain-containing protein [Prolixibacteraceae bacterium]
MRWIIGIVFLYLLTNCSVSPKLELGGVGVGDFGSNQTIWIESSHLPTQFEVHYWIRNRSKSPISIYRISSSCGCVSPMWDMHPVMPGDSTFVKVVIEQEKKQQMLKRCLIKHSGTVIHDTLLFKSR